MTPKQLSFDLPAHVSLGPDDYFVSGANANAYTMVTTPDSWSEGKLALVGPEGSGKSHLTRVFAHSTGATILNAAEIKPLCTLPNTAVAIEDMERLKPDAEETVFHLHNHLRSHRLPLLLTSDTAPSRWPIRLPDLMSRMQAAPVIEIGDPDDMLLTAVLMKHFSDRQLTPKPAVISYLVRHIERSYTAAAEIVARLDREALSTGQKVTVTMARSLIDSD